MGVYILIIQGHKVAVNGNRGANSVTTLKAVRKCKLTISEKNFAAAWVFYIIWNLRRPTQRIKTTIGWNLQNVCNVQNSDGSKGEEPLLRWSRAGGAQMPAYHTLNGNMLRIQNIQEEDGKKGNNDYSYRMALWKSLRLLRMRSSRRMEAMYSMRLIFWSRVSYKKIES